MLKSKLIPAAAIAAATAVTLIAAPIPGRGSADKQPAAQVKPASVKPAAPAKPASPVVQRTGSAKPSPFANQKRSLTSVSHHARLPKRGIRAGEPAIAGVTTDFATCFESGYTSGVSIDGQNGWITIPEANIGASVASGGAPEGNVYLVNQFNGLGAGTLQGAESPDLGVRGPGRATVSVKVNIGATGGADYFVDAVSLTEGLIVGELWFRFNDIDLDGIPGDILVIDDIGAGLEVVSTGVEYTPNTTLDCRMEIDSDLNRIKYFVNNALIHTGVVVSQNVGVEAVDIYSDNFHIGEVGKFDCLTVESAAGSCSADIAPNNIVDVDDLVAVILTWGTSGQGDVNGNGVVDVDDLVAVILGWGPCGPVSGGCCVGGGCSTLAYADCINGGGSYQGNDVSCASVECPLAPSDTCGGAADITGNINGAPIAATNAAATPAFGVGNDPEIPAGSPTCQWLATPTDTHNTVWFKFVAPSDGIHIATCNSPEMEDSIIALYSGTCGGLTEVACSEDVCGGSTFLSEITTGGLTVGNTYFVMVACPGSYAGSVPGEFALELDSFTSQANDECIGASTINALPFTQVVNVGDYTTNVTDPDSSCEIAVGGPFSKTGGWWYKFTPNFSGTITVRTCGTAAVEDTVVSVYTGSCGGLTQMFCDDDTCDPGIFGRSTITGSVTSGTTYLIFIDCYNGGGSGPNGEFGPVTVNITTP